MNMSEKQNNNEQINNFTIKEIAIKDNKKKIYEALWKDNYCVRDIEIQRVFWRKDKKSKEDIYSKNSYAFQIEYGKGNIIDNKNISDSKYFDSICKKLTEIFGIEDKDDRFKDKLREACSGSGSEQRRITTLHSSSLCALLFFYNVSKENPLTLKIDSKEITFKDVLFEFQNAVIKNPSNVDVVLLGEIKEEKKKVILFLESKFSEYLSNGNTNISDSYLKEECPIGCEIYNNEQNLSKLGIEFKKEKEEKVLNKDNKYTLQQTTKEKYYIHGIKQMISHYIGINNLLNGNLCENNTEKLKELYAFLSGNDNKIYNEEKLKEMLNDDNTKIYLGEIMFDFRNMDDIDDKEYFDNYNEKYEKLSEILNKLEEKEGKSRKKINILPKLLTYSLFKDNKEKNGYKIEHKIENNIKQYYKFD
jgi:hypothetical protein